MDKHIYYDVTIDESIISRRKPDEIDPAVLEEIKSSINELSERTDDLDSLMDALSHSTADSEAGAYGLRYYNGKLQVKSNNTWVTIPLDGFPLNNN